MPSQYKLYKWFYVKVIIRENLELQSKEGKWLENYLQI
jgi:hypothetical protein